VEAKRIASTQEPIANEGSYVLGYIASVEHQNQSFQKEYQCAYLGSFVEELRRAFQNEPLPRVEEVAKPDMQGL
jgi:fructose-1,6-bisphosphatase